MAASAWQFLLSQPASTLSEQVRELSPEQIRNLLHALSDGLVDIASVPTSTSAASSQASAPTGPPSPEQIRNLLHALSDGLVDIASVPTSTSAASSQASAPTGPPAFLPHPGRFVCLLTYVW
eukprot:s8802_g1.t1